MSVPPPAPFWRRYAAWSLDFAVLGTLATLLAWPDLVHGWRDASAALHTLSGLLGHALAQGLLQGASTDALARQLLADPPVRAAAAMLQSGVDRSALAWLLAYAVLAALYHIGFECSPWRGSPGKHALQLRVGATLAHRATPSRVAVRHVAGALSWLTLNLGHLLAAVPPQKRALHDWIAGLRIEYTASAVRLPGWARLWLALQVAAGVGFAMWAFARYVAALQASLA